MLRVGGVVFDVAAQAHDEVIDGASVCVFVDAPDLFKDLLARDDLAFALSEVAEEVSLHEGEMGRAIGGDEFEDVEANGAMVEISAADESTSAKPKIAGGKPLRSKQ